MIENSLLLYKARNFEEFRAGIEAEVAEGVAGRIARVVERRVERAVVLALHVDALAQVNVRVALLYHLLLENVLHGSEVVIAIAYEHTINGIVHGHTFWLASNELKLNT